MCHCWNNLWMKWHALSLVKKLLLCSSLVSFTQTEQKLISYLCEWLISFPTTYYHTKATLAADLKAAILSMNGADSLMFVLPSLLTIMRNIKYAENICDLHSFPVYKKPNSRLMRAIHACASSLHYAGVGKHFLSEVRVTQLLDPLAECTLLF